MIHEMILESKMIGMIALTIMGDIDGSARSENGENAGIVKAGGVRGTVFDLEAETQGMSTYVCQVIRCVNYPGAIERGVRTSGIGDGETILREGAQDSAGVVEEF